MYLEVYLGNDRLGELARLLFMKRTVLLSYCRNLSFRPLVSGKRDSVQGKSVSSKWQKERYLLIAYRFRERKGDRTDPGWAQTLRKADRRKQPTVEWHTGSQVYIFMVSDLDEVMRQPIDLQRLVSLTETMIRQLTGCLVDPYSAAL